jgi:dienelactone hydrolase
MSNDWTDLCPESLVSAPCLIEQTLCQPPASDGDPPQFAKDVKYATAVLDAWRETDAAAEWTPKTYADASGTNLYGHFVRRCTGDETVPGIVLFHTGAGPHDLFLLWKAASLVNEGYVVLIADLLSDPTGYSWSPDRSFYNKARDKLFRIESNQRPVLQERIQAAVDTLKGTPGVDSTRLAALGWCLGGHAILELCRMNISLKSMATFHGVFDTLPWKDQPQALSGCEILISHGVDDVSSFACARHVDQ